MGGTKHRYGAKACSDLLMFAPQDLQVITDPKHPQYDPRAEREIDEAMVVSIMRLGVIEPLVIARDGQTVYVVDGRQRRKNAIEANRRLAEQGAEQLLIPCTWRRGDDARLYETTIAANEVRSGDSPIERARKMQHLADMGRDVDQIAAVFGCVPLTVRNGLALLECANEVQSAVESGKLPMTAAIKLSKLARTEQVQALRDMIVSGATKGAAAQRAAKQAAGGEPVARGPRVRSRQVLERLRVAVAERFDDPELDKVIAFALGYDADGDDALSCALREVL